MTCDRVQAELSQAMDEDHVLSSDASRHLSACADCVEFRAAAVAVSRGYELQVRAGIDRLRRLDAALPLPASSRRRWARLLVPLAAAALLCWRGIEPDAPSPPTALVHAVPSPAGGSTRARLFEDFRSADDEEEASLVLGSELLLPVRLDQEFFPSRSSDVEVRLPVSLRF